MIKTATNAVTSAEFLAGLRWGVGVLVVTALVALAWRRWRTGVAPVIGLAATLAAVLAMPTVRPLPTVFLQGVGVLVLGGLSSQLLRYPVWSFALAAPGAWLVAFQSGMPGARWVPWFLFGVIVIAAPLAAAFDRQSEQTGLSPVLLLMTIGGVFATLPDTEEGLVLLGAIAPIVVLAWPKPLASVGPGFYPLLGILMWVIAWGGRGREGAIIGAAACLGVLVAGPVALVLAKRQRSPTPISLLGLALLHGGVVYVAARIAGLLDDPLTAGAIAVGAIAAGALGCWILIGPGRSEYVTRRMDGPHRHP